MAFKVQNFHALSHEQHFWKNLVLGIHYKVRNTYS